LGEPVTRFAGAAAEQLMNPHDYVTGVLGDGATPAHLTDER
jgi:hypothetical protein